MNNFILVRKHSDLWFESSTICACHRQFRFDPGDWLVMVRFKITHGEVYVLKCILRSVVESFTQNIVALNQRVIFFFRVLLRLVKIRNFLIEDFESFGGWKIFDWSSRFKEKIGFWAWKFGGGDAIRFLSSLVSLENFSSDFSFQILDECFLLRDLLVEFQKQIFSRFVGLSSLYKRFDEISAKFTRFPDSRDDLLLQLDNFDFEKMIFLFERILLRSYTGDSLLCD